MYRSAFAGGEYVGINDRMINNTWYRDTDLLLNQTWYYRVSALNFDGLESALSGYVSATTGQIVTLMSDYRGKADSVVTLLINTENANGIAAAYGLDVEVTYDTEILTPLVQWDPATEVETVEKTVLTQDLIVSTNSQTAAGQINIVGYSTQTQGITLVGEGHLFDVKFHVSEFASSTDPALHTFTDVTFRDFNQQTLPVDFTDTATFTVASTYLRGDLTGDGVVDDDDVAMALMIDVGMIIPTPDQLIAGDLNGDGVIDSADITLISRLIKGLPVNPGGSRTEKSQADSYNLTVGDGTGYPADSVRVPIRINDASGFSGVDLRLDFDPSVLTDFTAYTTPLTGDFDLTYYYQVDSGWINIALSRSNNLTEEDQGDLVEIGFQVQSGARPGMTSVLHLAQQKLSGQFGGDKSWEFDVTSQDGLFQIIGTPSPPPTTTPTPSATPTPTSTPLPTSTPPPSAIPTPPLTPTPIATPTLPPPTATPYPTPEYLVLASGDYDGDGISDIAIFRQDCGLWSIKGLGNTYFGKLLDLPAPGDYDGDGLLDVAIYRPSSGLWAVKNITRFYFGGEEDLPVSGDYNGDGTCDSAVFRESNGLWSVRGVTARYFGANGDLPVPNDYDDDGTTDIAIFRGSSGLWAVLGTTRCYFGKAGDLPVPGIYKWTGSFPNIPAIYRPATGLWASRAETRFYYGTQGDKSLTGDFTGDALDNNGIFRSNLGLWAIRDVTRVYYGRDGDTPLSR